MPVDPLWMNASAGAPAYDAAELRRAFAMLLTQGVSDRFGARGGVHPAGSNAVSISGMTVTVLDTKAVVYPTGNSQRGPYIVQLPSKAHVVPTADASLPRKDIVQLRIRDDDEDSSGLRQADTEYKTGTPNSTPAEPAVDTDAIKLALVDVPAGSSTPTLTYQALSTVAVGGVLPVRNAGELPTAGVYEGMYADQADTDELKRWTGSAWSAYGSQYRPVISNQVSDPPFNVTATWTAFSGSAWPATVFTVPPSGQVKVVMSATLGNESTSLSTGRLSFALSGGHTLSATFSRSLTACAVKAFVMSRTVYVTGMTAGASVTLTPWWYISSGSSSTAQIKDGVITIEPIA